MTIYYTATDIDDLVANGVTKIELGDGVKITDYARDRAVEVGIELVMPGSVSPKSGQRVEPAQTESRWNKPQGCQHGPLRSN
jgi:hypothetical protein